MRRRLHLLLPLLVLILGVSLRVWDPPLLRELRYRAFDLFQQIEPRPADPAPVRIVALDDASLAKHGQWPWPRPLLALLVNRLAEAGAAAIAFDVLFAEPDRTSPDRLLALLPNGPARDALAAALAEGHLLDHDAIFAEAIIGAPVVLGFAATTTITDDRPLPHAGISFVGETPAAYVRRFTGALPALPLLDAAAKGAGALNVIKDEDGTIRRIPLVLAVGSDLYPSLAAEALRVAQGAKGMTVKVSGAVDAKASGADTGVQAVKIGRIVAPTVPSGELWLYDSGPRPERYLPAWQILAGEFDPALVAGHVVFVGATALGTFDTHATPLAAVTPGVEQHAQVVEQLLTGRFLDRPAWAEGLELLGVAGFGLLVLLCFAVLRLGALWAGLLGFIAVAAAAGFAWYAFTAWRFLLDPLTPAVVGLAVYAAAGAMSYLVSERQRRQVRQAFGHYVSPAVVARIAENPRQVRLGGEARELTLMFCDIRDFTSLSETLDPESLTRLVNRFLTEMSDAVLATAGTIDKFIGDCIMAFWNAPLDVPRHQAAAASTIIEMRRRLRLLNQALAEEAGGGTPLQLRVGIGLHTGSCSVGNLGSAQRLAYTAVGDPVNVASRLEGMTKLYGLDCLASDSVQAAAAEYAWLEVDRIRVKGRQQPVTVYALLGDNAASESVRVLVAAQAAFLQPYRAGDWAAAEVALQELTLLAREAGLAALAERYRFRLQTLELEPPPADWDGVFNAQEK